MENLFISNLNKKDVNHFTTDFGLKFRKKHDKAIKNIYSKLTSTKIIMENICDMSDDEYFSNLSLEHIPVTNYDLTDKKNGTTIVVERYPKLDDDESYIFVGNHSCPEDIETMLKIIDRNAYLVLGSVESLKYDKEMYASWLVGMIVFDILNEKERKDLMPKMERVLKTNSILIFPEGSHNYSPNEIINPLFDGPVNLALNTGKKIVPVTQYRDNENNVAFVDVGNPIDIRNVYAPVSRYYPFKTDNEKYRIKSLSSYLRDKMATSNYALISRHAYKLRREDYDSYDEILSKYQKDVADDVFSKLKWRHDVFDAEYLTKKNEDVREYNDVAKTISNLRLSESTLKNTLINNRYYVNLENLIEKEDVPTFMRNEWIKRQNNKVLVKKK